MDIKQNAKRKTYSKELKLRAVKMRLEEGYSIPLILQKLGITKDNQVKEWIRK